MKIGQVAALAGVNIETLRYYERRGILEEPERRPSGYREYPAETARLVRFIKRAQEVGFTLNEIEELIALRNNPARKQDAVRGIAATKIADVDQKIRRLQAIKRALGVLVKSCACSQGAVECPILDALDDDDHTPRRHLDVAH
jgi:Hg(II)-responsive transcriptional regulator